jgi:CHASE2 domain-containing sensor protein
MLTLVGVSAAASVTCFDIARRATPRAEVGITVAIVNSGGFSAASLGSAVIGLWLGGHPSAARFEDAVLGVMLAITAIGFLGSARLARGMASAYREAARQPSHTSLTPGAAARP